jgi:hypothetical protein
LERPVDSVADVRASAIGWGRWAGSGHFIRFNWSGNRGILSFMDRKLLASCCTRGFRPQTAQKVQRIQRKKASLERINCMHHLLSLHSLTGLPVMLDL